MENKKIGVGGRLGGLSSLSNRMLNILRNGTIYIILFLLILVVIIKEPSFCSFRIFIQILEQASTRVILALGVAGIIIIGGTDLSAGRMIGMAAVISASLMQDMTAANRLFAGMPHIPVLVGILVAIFFCVLFSTLHGTVVAVFKVAPFIASLGFQLLVYGAMSLYFDKISSGSPIGSLDPAFKAFAQGSTLGIPNLILFCLACTLIVGFIWNKTRLGKNMYAIGGNSEAAVVCGINVVKDIILIYVLAGLLYGFAGSLEVARTGSTTNELGADYALDAIAACVVGGVSMRGGVGKVTGVVIGVILFQVVNYGLVYIGVNANTQYVVRGLIILVAVAIDTVRSNKKV